ncbi:di-trans,poly-cis-decaprenylcistransferase [Candidatus Woesearchaeota archaeon]|nr:di-trans,poly-cis-decaprenylcistransferase [Candidatus Woesearchaeota archaeon]
MNIPQHIGIILDGNRRWAKAQGLPAFKGHQEGAENCKRLLGWCKELGIKGLSLYCFSMENFKRSKAEVAFLMKLFERFFDIIIKSKEIKQDKVHVKVLGRKHLFPKSLQKKIAKAEEATRNYAGYQLNLCMAYGGRQEIVDAVKRIGEAVQLGDLDHNEIDEKTIAERLYTSSEPELIIRTSGEQRTSNFLIWQAVYSEWVFYTKPWPAFTKEDLIACIKEYNARERRFGK